MPSRAEASAESVSGRDTQNTVPILVDFLNTVPHQLTFVLIDLSPYISKIRSAAEIASWRSSSYDSWLFLAVWWAVCLLAGASLRFLFPITVLFTLSVTKWTSHPRSVSPPITEHNLQNIISDLAVIQCLIPTFPDPSLISLPILLRASAVLYIPYLLLTHLVSLRVILGISGTLLLTWRSPWAFTIRSTLSRSAWVRWSFYHTWSQLTGQTLPPRILPLQPISTSPQPVSAIRFLFTIYENQRWWMGLDWTAALLPGERPSWCSAAEHAVPPPNAFALPDETTVFLADGSRGMVKRTATWKWEEREWRVLVRKDGGGLSRVERPLPTGKEESISSSRLLRAAGKMKESSGVDPIASPSGIGDWGRADANSDADTVEGDPDEPAQEEATDTDGWIYGDNKWEGQSGKGGIGKYTRYRRWTRVAVVSEVVELVEDCTTGIQHGSPNANIHSDAQSTGVWGDESGLYGEKGMCTEHGSVTLRQRLNSALNPDSSHSNS